MAVRASRVVQVASVMVLIATPAVAGAQAGRGAFRLSLDGSFFVWESIDLQAPGTDAVSSSATRLAVVAPLTGVEMAYQVADEWLVGAQLSVVTTTASAHGVEDVDETEWRFGPTVEGAFSPGSTVRPTLRAFLGIAGGAASSGRESADAFGFFVGLGGGFHIMVTDSFSLSPILSFRYSTGTYDVGGVDVDQTIFTVWASLVFSGWMFGESGEAPAEVVSAYPQPAVPSVGQTPAPPSPQDTVRLQDDQVVQSLTLDGAELELIGVPQRNGALVGLRLTIVTVQPVLEGCNELVLSTGEERVVVSPLRYQPNAYGTRTREQVLGQVQLASLERTAGAQELVVRACSAIWVIDAANHERIRAFLQRFRSMAGAYGTLEAGSDVEAGTLGPGGTTSDPTPSSPLP